MSKGKDAEAASAVLKYLNRQNRPYSAIDVFNNLHKEYGKTSIVRCLEELAKDGKITEKVYGKQKVYVADQSQFPSVDETELKAMDAKIAELTSQLEQSRAQCKQHEREIGTLNSALTTGQVRDRIQELTEQCDKKQSRVDKLKSAGNHVSLQEKKAIYSSHETSLKAWRKRKRMAMDILDAILEGYPKTKKELFEDIGVETDEDCNVTIPR
ncbi:homologous-pairing protein 2 homolog [Diadema setosum]|uniref:homologous-pairing protein 2 homolog n=1 Tax=Diadema setosum TaxID=31175 RepID=UPI003B3A7A6A